MLQAPGGPSSPSRKDSQALHVKDVAQHKVHLQVSCPRALAGSIRAVELGLYGKCRLWMAERVRLRPVGHLDWTEFSCACVLSAAS